MGEKVTEPSSMRFYFHISNGELTAEDDYGMELPTFLAAFEEGAKIARELLDDPDTADLRGGVIHIVGSQGRLFISLPIVPVPTGATVLH
jgi:hypothetical protein